MRSSMRLVDPGDWRGDPGEPRRMHRYPLGKIRIQFHQRLVSSPGRTVVADRRPVGKPARDVEQQRRQIGHEIVTPLSTGSTWPVTMRDSEDRCAGVLVDASK